MDARILIVGAVLLALVAPTTLVVYLKKDNAAPVTKPKMEIKIDSPVEEGLRFERIYTATLNNHTSIRIMMHTYSGYRDDRSELYQPNGRWVVFDMKAVADKILDPVLVPLVQKYVDEIRSLDAEFVKSDPDTFVDDHGHRWNRQP